MQNVFEHFSGETANALRICAINQFGPLKNSRRMSSEPTRIATPYRAHTVAAGRNDATKKRVLIKFEPKNINWKVSSDVAATKRRQFRLRSKESRIQLGDLFEIRLTRRR